jgi:AcrR family transcriptional regulator
MGFAGHGEPGMSSDSESGSPPRRRLSAEARRQVILDAALDAFADGGFNETSLETVAARAGVSKALIYEHFKSKRELHQALLETYVLEMLVRITGAIAGAESAEDRLRAGLEGFLAFVEDSRDAWRMLIRNRANADVSDFFERLFAEVAEMVGGLMASDFPESALPEGAEFELVVEATARQLMGSITAIADWWDENRGVPRAQVLAMVMEFAWVGLERAAAGERWEPPQT